MGRRGSERECGWSCLESTSFVVQRKERRAQSNPRSPTPTSKMFKRGRGCVSRTITYCSTVLQLLLPLLAAFQVRRSSPDNRS